MSPQIEMVKEALRSLYDAVGTITAFNEETNENTHVSSMRKVDLAVKFPCRINVEDAPPAFGMGVGPEGLSKRITLIMDPTVDVPPGALLTVTYSDGTKQNYESSGEVVRYSHHQEIALKQIKEYT